jgi:exosome complex RNA-binding protein Csl4
MDITTMREQIMFNGLTNDQLDSILTAVRFAKAQLIQQNKNEFRVGTIVKFTKSKTGAVVYGTVEKVNRKYVIVNEKISNSLVGAKWRVPANMLEPACGRLFLGAA